MTRSFSSLCITNAICLTSLWILIALGIYVAKMQRDQDFRVLFYKMRWNETLNFSGLKEDDVHYQRILSMQTIEKSLIWFGFVLDSAVCLTEFMVVWLKIQAPPVKFYLLSVGRYLTYILSVHYYDLTTKNYSWESITLLLVLYALLRIYMTVLMCFINKKFSNEVDGIIIPVAYAVGPTGKKAMAGA